MLSDQVRQQVIDKVKAATWFTVIADEVTDVSNKEQLSLVLRYVDTETMLSVILESQVVSSPIFEASLMTELQVQLIVQQLS